MEYHELKKKIAEAEACEHSHLVIKRKRIRGGSFQAVQQCSKCGARVGGSISYAKLGKRIEDLPDWDEELATLCSEELKSKLRDAWTAEKIKQIELKISEYDQYLSSEEWRSKAAKVLERDRHRCQACLVNKATQVHHTTYNHIYDEPLFELVSVCKPCHEKLHPEDSYSLRRMLESLAHAEMAE